MSADRASDRISVWLLALALAVMSGFGVRVLAIVLFQESQGVVNQRTDDRILDLTRRVEQMEHVRPSERLEVLEKISADQRTELEKVRNLEVAIFTGLAINLISNIVQVRRSPNRRR